MEVPQKIIIIIIELPYDPAVLLLGIGVGFQDDMATQFLAF